MKFEYIFIVLLLGMTACSKSNSVSRNHEKENLSLEKRQDIESLQSGGDLTLLGKSTSSESDITNFEKSILDPAELLDPRKANLNETREKMGRFNRAILELYKKNRDFLTKNKTLEKYQAILLHSCGDDLRTCDSIEILKQDPQSAEIAILIAESKKDVAEYYKFLLVAFSLQNREAKPHLLGLYLKRASELSAFVKTHPQNRLFVDNTNFLAIVLANPTLRSNPEFSGLLRALNPWQYSAKMAKEERADALNVFLANLQNNLYLKSGSLTPEFAKAQAEIQNETGSFLKRQDHLFESKKQIAINLNLQKLSKQDEYFYLIDRLFNEHIELNQAYLIWDLSHKDLKSFETTLKNYVQIEFAERVIIANQKMSRIFDSGNPIVASELYSEVIVQSREISVGLKEFISKVSTLNQVILYSLSKTGALKSETSEYLKSTAKNIYYYVVLPHMMMLSYQMYKRDFKRKVAFAYGSFEIDGSNVTQMLYHGTFKPWFDYSSVDQKLAYIDVPEVKAQELFYAFDIAMNIEAFEAFKIDTSEYIFDLFTQLFGGLTRIVSNDYLDLQTHFESDTDWMSVVNLCEGVKSGRGYQHRVDARKPYDLNLKASKESAFEKAAFLGPWVEKLQTKTGFQFHNGDRTLSLDYVRILLEPTNKLLRQYTELYKIYLKKIGATDVAAKTEKLEGLYNQSEKLIKNYMKKLIKINSQYTDCFFVLMNKEIEIQGKLLFKRIEFLKSVYADMTTLRKEPGRRAELNQKHRFVNAGNVIGIERFNENTFSSLALDFIIESKRFYENSKDPIENQVSIVFPDNFLALQEYKSPKVISIAYASTEDEFVNNGLNAIIRRKDENSVANLRWFDTVYLNTRNFTYFSRDLVSFKRIDASRDLIKDEELFKLPIQIWSLLNLKPLDIEVLSKAKLTGRFSPSVLTDYINFAEFKPIAYFDYIFYMSFQDFLSRYMLDPFPEVGGERITRETTAGADSNLVPHSKEAANFDKILSQKLIHFFTLEINEVSDSMTEYYRMKIQSETALSEALKTHANELYQSDLASNQLKTFSIELGKNYTVPYLSSEMRGNYDGYIFGLKQRTQNIFAQ